MTPTVGQYLRENRERAGYSLQDIASAINVRVAQLRAIEDGEPEKLPGMIYAVGFVKSYARLLGLDALAVSNQYKMEYDGGATPVQKKEKKLIVDDPHADNRIPNGIIILIAVVLFLVVLTVWYIFRPDLKDERETLTSVPPAPVMETAEPELEPGQPVTAPPNVVPDPVLQAGAQDTMEEAPAPGNDIVQMEGGEDAVLGAVENPSPEIVAAPPVAVRQKPLALKDKGQLHLRHQESRITIIAAESVWLEIIDGSRRSLFKKLLRKGEAYQIPDVPGLMLSTGNAGVMMIYVDGKKVPPIGKPGDILRGVSISPETLKEREEG